jgi:hypothetical protein
MISFKAEIVKQLAINQGTANKSKKFEFYNLMPLKDTYKDNSVFGVSIDANDILDGVLENVPFDSPEQFSPQTAKQFTFRTGQIVLVQMQASAVNPYKIVEGPGAIRK